MPDGETASIERLGPVDGDPAASPDDHRSRTWQVTLDAQIRLEDASTSLRQNLMLTAVVIALATPILRRFLLFTGPETLLVSLLPAVMLIAGALIDGLWYDRRVRAMGDRIADLEAKHPDAEALEATREAATGRRFSRAGLLAYYLVPAALVLAVALWRYL